jgi:predicted small secreted protein
MSIKKLLLGLCLIVGMWTVASSMTGCNTTRGVGEDIEGAGEGIQKAVD